MGNILDGIEVMGLEFDFADAASRKQHDDIEKRILAMKIALGMPGGGRILGLQVDYENKKFTRLGAAAGLNPGTDFDQFTMYGGRKRCNVTNDGIITAWYGDANFSETGSNGQVMVYQPKFYYMVLPVKYNKISGGEGYHLRCCNYYISEELLPGFKLHPAFYDRNGNEIEYILESAYEGCIYDASVGKYLTRDEQVADFDYDELSSVVNMKPCSGLTQNLTRVNVDKLVQNRGIDWHSLTIQVASAEQLLMIIELGTMNSQSAIGNGVVSISDNPSYNCSSLTGSTSSLGNKTGRATSTINEKGGTTTTETADGNTSVTYRGVENFYGNLWKFVDGVNIYGNGNMNGGMPYICDDFNFVENKNTDNYKPAGFTVTNASGYISAMGYSEEFDWLFMTSEVGGNSALPVGDYQYVTSNLNEYRIALLGGHWNDGSLAGCFYWDLTYGSGRRDRDIGCRLVCIPTAETVDIPL